jgi:hypothetical protein
MQDLTLYNTRLSRLFTMALSAASLQRDLIFRLWRPFGGSGRIERPYALSNRERLDPSNTELGVTKVAKLSYEMGNFMTLAMGI